MRVRSLRAGLVCAAASLLLVACTGTPTSGSSGRLTPGHLAVAGDQGFNGATFPDIAAGSAVSVTTVMLCTTGGPVSVVSVSPIEPVGRIEVVGWALRPNPFQTGADHGLGEFPGPLPPSSGWVTGTDATVTAACPASATADPTDVLTELGVTVRRDGAAGSSFEALRVGYTSGGAAGSLDVPFGVGLCPTEVVSAACKPVVPTG